VHNHQPSLPKELASLDEVTFGGAKRIFGGVRAEISKPHCPNLHASRPSKLGMAFKAIQRKTVDNMINKLKRPRVKPLKQKKPQEQSYEEQAFEQ